MSISLCQQMSAQMCTQTQVNYKSVKLDAATLDKLNRLIEQAPNREVAAKRIGLKSRY
jgi:hypothetical protein